MELKHSNPHLSAWIFLAGIAVLLGLARNVHYLLFHSLAELIAITVSFSIFTLTWSSQKHLKNNYLIILGAAYGTIGVVNVFHTLTFKGMNLFPGVTTNYPTQFWLAARFIEAIALLLAALLIRRKVNFGFSAGIFAIAGLAGCLAIWFGLLPATFVDGVGLTPFKVGSEYVIVAILVAGLALLWRVRHEFPRDVFRLVAGSLLLAIATEICFIHYVSFYDFVNELGHYFRLVSVFMAYLAIVVTGVRNPSELLFRQLKEKERALEILNSHLAESESRLERAELTSKTGNWEFHADTNTIIASEGLTKIYGVDQNEFELATIRSYALLEYHQTLGNALKNLVEKDEPYDIEFKIRTADTGSVRDIHSIATFDRATRTVFGVIQDITERKQADAGLRLAASVFTHAREGIAITDAAGCIVEINDPFTRITGYSREEILGQNPRMLKSGRHGAEFYAGMWKALIETGYWSGEIWNKRKNGEIYVEMITISAVRDSNGHTQNYVALFTDITMMKEHQKQLEHIAHYDALTNLPNRLLLADRLQHAIAQSQRRGKSLAVVYLDLDGFKAVNDSYGHEVGDQLLIAVAQRMKTALREGDTLARLGGDEFVALLVDLERPQDCEPVLARLLQAAADPLEIGHATLQVSASIGVTLYPHDGADADKLLRHADQAMYLAKQAGKNRYHMFDIVQDKAVKSLRENIQRMRRAIDQQEFVLYFQPKVNMEIGTVIGVEALIRWQHPERGLLSPADFLPGIEDHPISIELGEWVIETALEQISAWQAAGLDISISVNISAYQLQQENFMQRLTSLLKAHPDVLPDRLELEVLETSALEDVVKISELMHSCRDIGVSFALDDFGTGYSSLTYLRRLPASLLKIDQSFIHDMLEDTDDLAIVEGVVGLAMAFRRQVIAEGVETAAHGQLLLPLGCVLAQGYFIARPMPGTEIPAWIAKWQPDPLWTHWRDNALKRDSPGRTLGQRSRPH